eukprot:NODE_34_length_31639_cov_0.254375.p5 type:complete len:354 gc:universal NODE_34_length_31639_cov_0.254375:10104-9043(-)
MLGEALCEFLNELKPRSCKPLKSKGALTDQYNLRAFSTKCEELGFTISPSQISIYTIKELLVPLFSICKKGDPLSILDEKIMKVKKEDDKFQDLSSVLDAILERLEKLEMGIDRLPSNITLNLNEPLEDFSQVPKEENAQQSMVFEEFLRTEKSYCQDLVVFDQVYLREIRNRHLLHQNLNDDLDLFVRNLIEFSESLIKLLEERKNLECLGEIDSESFELFKEYAVTFTEVTRVLSILKYKSEYVEFFDLWRTSEAKGQPVDSFLIKPIQRLCRYPLMLKEYAKNMPNNKSIFEVIETILLFITKVNEITISSTDDKKKHSIQSKIKETVMFNSCRLNSKRENESYSIIISK